MTWKNKTRPNPLAGVITSGDGPARRAAELAARLDVPLLAHPPADSLVVRVGANHLELVHCQPHGDLAVRVEFVLGAAGYRRQKGGREMLLRAVGARKGERPDVLDGTGGLGRDSFVLAQAGCRVQLFERHPVLALLLEDGLRRAADSPETKAAAERITLHGQDVLEYLKVPGPDLREKTPVIYLDPMYPGRDKAAKAKKELQLLQLLLGDSQNREHEEAILLEAALQAAGKRVVVKRPRRGPFLGRQKPSYCLEGRSTRFDIYLTRGR
ncbi:ribosomal RNA small subunit methyltransferase J [Desulfolithobacter dissulfuricans]|uniref:Ribosomal RNA small subunit methyltransferase J n=1 Tax=Desulfolithobacter dissulfuricans TaxID=2795293 RepID=A0A915XKF6_9BACT|nr:class I SAM-dependent methyltransferase [Desulfolithobacter dissulfuricans]BCO09148.1 ribosomal RNA small subunit methyltransferase J [Desulfolithobacter dissulfuricans]